MSKKDKAIQHFKENLHVLQCPICRSSFNVHLHSLKCEKQHTFDFSKQSYLNLLTAHVKTHYEKALFVSRQNIIVQSKLYNPIHKEIAKILNDRYRRPFTITDLGCGEGSHLKEITNYLHHDHTGIGIDISKEGILIAAKTYEQTMWLVGDLAKTPLKDNSIDVLLNILSPANYKEFRRIAANDALLIKIVPVQHYLRELREFLFGAKVEEINEPIDLFKKQVQLDTILPIQYKKTLNHQELTELVQMTPLTWSADSSKIKDFLQQESCEITIDVNILIATINK